MNTQIIQDDDLSAAQSGGKDLLDGDFEEGISRAFLDDCFAHPLLGERGNQVVLALEALLERVGREGIEPS